MKSFLKKHKCTALCAAGALALAGCARTSKVPLAPEAIEPPLSTENPGADPNAFRSVKPPPGLPSPLNYPETQLSSLANGLSTWVIPWNAPTLSLRFACRREPDPEGKAGLSSLFNRLLTEGTKQKSALELAVAAETLGTILDYETTHDALSLGLTVLPEDLEPALALLAEVVRSPRLARKDFDRLKAERLDDIALQRQDPARLAWLFGYRALLGKQLGTSTSGTPAQVSNLTHGDILGYQSRALDPARCGLLAAGPIDSAALAHAAASPFGSWHTGSPRPGTRPSFPARPVPPESAAPPPQRPGDSSPAANRLLWVDRPGTVQTSLWVGVHAPRYAEPGHDDRQVLSNLFGGLFTSRLNLNLREKHAYTYGASSAAVATNRFGAFVVSTSVETKTTSAALSEIFAELSKLKQPGTLTQEELTRSVTDLVFNVAAQLDHTDQLLESATAQFVHQLPLDRFSRYAETLRNVTQATTFRETARIPDQGFTIVVVGDRSVIGSLGRFAAQEEAVDLAWLE